MKYLPLLFANLKRHKLRTVLTMCAIVVAFLLFGILAAVNKAFNAGVDLAGEERLILRNKVTLIQPLPIAYKGRIEAVDGVDAVAHATWFGGIYQDAKNFFPQIAVVPESFLDLHPEYVLDEDEMARWKETRTGAIAGAKLAEKYGWEVGDKIPIQGTAWRRAGSDPSWEFDLVGIYEGASKNADESQFFFRHDYLVEGTGGDMGIVGWYIIRVSEPERAATIAQTIDDGFANSSTETKTEPEKAFVQGFANQIGNTAAIIRAVVAAVFFTLLLVAGNTMALAVRERTNELGVLKALGFSGAGLLGLVLAESCLVAFLGGAVGLALAALMIPGIGQALSSFLPVFYFPPEAVVVGVGLILFLGLATGLIPAVQAMRLNTAEALRRA